MKFVMNKRIYLSISIFLFLVLITIYLIRIDARSRNFRLYVFELKNNMAVFLQTSGGKRILINGGGNSEIIRKITKVIPFYSRHIDTIISTNEEDKNITGLISVVDRYKVDRAYLQKINSHNLNFSTTSSKIYDTYIHELKARKIYVQELIKGDAIKLDENTKIEVLFPVQFTDFKYSKSSSPELVLVVSYKDFNFLSLGNVSKKIQKYLLSDTFLVSNFATSTNALIIPHGLSKSNTDERLLDTLNHKIIIYSQAKGGIFKDAYNIKETGSIFMDISDGDIGVHRI